MSPIGTQNGFGSGNVAFARAGCDNNWNHWWLGSRTQWNVTKDFYMGVDVLYQKIERRQLGQWSRADWGRPGSATNTLPRVVSATRTTGRFGFRVHRDFYP